jgi:hypothetical protein
MITCSSIQFISDEEYIGNSLSAINTNFQELTSVACEVQQYLDARVNIRTFFYYGPNSPTSTTEQDNQSKKPSPVTIERFANSENGLNLIPISEIGDYAWIIYQRTGWASQSFTTTRSDSGTVYKSVQIRRIGRLIGWATYGQNWSVTRSREDIINQNIPLFVLYKLRFNGTQYVMIPTASNNRNPLYVRSTTASTNDWNKPQNWGQYSQWNSI